MVSTRTLHLTFTRVWRAFLRFMTLTISNRVKGRKSLAGAGQRPALFLQGRCLCGVYAHPAPHFYPRLACFFAIYDAYHLEQGQGTQVPCRCRTAPCAVFARTLPVCSSAFWANERLSFVSNRRFFALLTLIALFGLGARLSGIGHHLPSIVVEDEGSDLSVAVRLLQGEIPLSHVRYHRSLIAYHNLIGIGAVGGFAFVSGQARNAQEFQQFYFAQREVFTLATRVTMAILTTLAIVVIGLAGRMLSPYVGISSALLLSLNGYVTLNSMYAMPDALVLLPTALVIYGSLYMLKRPTARAYFATGLAIALVMLAKLNGILVASCVLLAHFVVSFQAAPTWQGRLRRAVLHPHPYLLLVGVGVGNVLFNPLPFFYPEDLAFELRRLYDLFFGSDTTGNASRALEVYRGALWEWGRVVMGASLVTFLVGLGTMLYRRDRLAYLLLFVTAIAMFWLILASQLGASAKTYYWMPFVVVASLIGGIGVASLWQAGKFRVLSLTAVVLMLVLALGETVSLLRVVRQPDTHQLARNFIEANIPPNSKIMAPPNLIYGVPLQRNADSIKRALAWGHPPLAQWQWWLALSESERPHLVYDLYGYETFSQIDTWDDWEKMILDEGISYYITMDYCQNFRSQPDSTSALDFPPVDGALFAEWELMATFSPFGSTTAPDETCYSALETRTGLVRADGMAYQQRAGAIFKIYAIPPSWRAQRLEQHVQG